MAIRRQTVQHPLLKRLRRLDREAATLFPSPYDPGFGSLGLILDRRLDQGRYPSCTPATARTFACTGGDGVHFSLLLLDEMITEQSPVIMTVPPYGGLSWVVGENLFDFLCLGTYRGYFALDQLVYHKELTLKVFLNPDWQPSESWHGYVGYGVDDHNRKMLGFLREKLHLTPWTRVEKFDELQEQYGHMFEFPAE